MYLIIVLIVSSAFRQNSSKHSNNPVIFPEWSSKWILFSREFFTNKKCVDHHPWRTPTDFQVSFHFQYWVATLNHLTVGSLTSCLGYNSIHQDLVQQSLRKSENWWPEKHFPEFSLIFKEYSKFPLNFAEFPWVCKKRAIFPGSSEPWSFFSENIYLFIYLFVLLYLFIYLFIYLFSYLLTYLLTYLPLHGCFWHIQKIVPIFRFVWQKQTEATNCPWTC